MSKPGFIRKPFRYVFWNAALILIGINVLVYLFNQIDPVQVRFLGRLYPRSQILPSLVPALFFEYHMYWQVFTYQFVHGSFWHLISNMLGLLIFGVTVERRIGSKEFLLLYLLTGTLSGILSLGFYMATGNITVILLGASGAVFGILLAYAVLFPRSVIFIWGIIPVPAPILVLLYAGYEVFNMFARTGGNIAHFTHLGGFAVAWLYFRLRFGIKPWRVWFNR